MSRAALLCALALAACSSSAKDDPTKARCAPHWKLELDCADEETRKGMIIIGDLCQKVLNGKNREFFGPAAERRMEAELACAKASADCKSYAACKDALEP